jgi:RNA polymerase sigma factor (sigma-70 family)
MNSKQDHREWVLAALDQFEGRLLRYATRLLGNLDEARDVVQFAFLKLCDQSQEKVGERLSPWLYSVCRNRAMDVLRAGKSVAAEHGNGSGPAYDREIDPAEGVERAELHGLLRTLVDELPANQREAIDLWADGFSYAHISQIIKQSEGHVRVIVHRGLKALREQPRVVALMSDAEPEPSVREVSPLRG